LGVDGAMAIELCFGDRRGILSSGLSRCPDDADTDESGEFDWVQKSSTIRRSIAGGCRVGKLGVAAVRSEWAFADQGLHERNRGRGGGGGDLVIY